MRYFLVCYLRLKCSLPRGGRTWKRTQCQMVCSEDEYLAGSVLSYVYVKAGLGVDARINSVDKDVKGTERVL